MMVSHRKGSGDLMSKTKGQAFSYEWYIKYLLEHPSLSGATFDTSAVVSLSSALICEMNRLLTGDQVFPWQWYNRQYTSYKRFIPNIN